VGAAVRNRYPVLPLILAGVAIGAAVGSGISLIKILANPYDQLPAITYWLLSSLTTVTRGDVLVILAAVVLGFIPLVLLWWRMNIMTLGDEEAQTLGVDTRLTRSVAPFSAPATCDREIATQALDRLGMTDLAARPYTEISGGERQMALIARALVQEPKNLLMDELTASLDNVNQMRVLSHISRLAGEGISVTFFTHNPHHVFMVADRVALLHDGALTGLGLPRNVLTAERLKQLYDIDLVIGSLPGSARRVQHAE
jgi:ABC-type enterochelin transport system ATPase subunit